MILASALPREGRTAGRLRAEGRRGWDTRHGKRIALENEKEPGEPPRWRRTRKSDGRIGRKQERGASVRDGGARSKVSQKSQMSLDLLARQLPETSGIPKMVPRARRGCPLTPQPTTSRRTSVSPASVRAGEMEKTPVRKRERERERGRQRGNAPSEAYTSTGQSEARSLARSLANFHF